MKQHGPKLGLRPCYDFANGRVGEGMVKLDQVPCEGGGFNVYAVLVK